MNRVILKAGTCYYREDEHKSAFWKDREKATRFTINDPKLQRILDRYPWLMIEDVE